MAIVVLNLLSLDIFAREAWFTMHKLLATKREIKSLSKRLREM